MNYGNPFREMICGLAVFALAVFPAYVYGQESEPTQDEQSVVVGEIVNDEGQAAIEGENETENAESTEEIASGQVMLKEDGSLSGVVFVLKDEGKTPVDAKVSLSSNGVIVDSVKADEEGVFSFPSVEPGTYDMFATADNMVASQAVEVMPYADGGYSSGIEMGMAYEPMNYTDSYAAPSYDAMYDSYGSMPVDTFASSAPVGGCGVATTSCGGCGGGGFGSRGGGLSRLRGFGLVGLAGLAGLGGRDASPAE